MTFRAVFCDIDGTLLDSNHEVGSATAEKIRSLEAIGTPFILVSARSPDGVYPIQDKIGIHAPLVCYGGALVMDGKRNPVHSLGFAMSQVIDVKARIRSTWKNVTVTVYSYNNWFVDNRNDPRVVTEAAITGALPTEITTEALTTHPEDAHKMLCIGDPADILAMETLLCTEYPELSMIKSSPIFLEIMHGQVNKSNAMKYLCQAMRLPLKEVVAFGDNYNDADMLENAGLGIAMGNAPAAVQQKADRTTADHDHEGVLQALKTLEFMSMANSVRFDRASF